MIAGELIRQSLERKDITSLVVLSRKPLTISNDVDVSIPKQVIIENYGTYLEHVKKELEGAGACIWYLGAVKAHAVNEHRHADFSAGPSRLRRARLDTTIGKKSVGFASSIRYRASRLCIKPDLPNPCASYT